MNTPEPEPEHIDMAKSEITLQHLVRAGLLFKDDLLFTNKEGFFAIATITNDGWMRVLKPDLKDDDLHDTPSGAARALKRLAVKRDEMKGTSVNGWTFWYVMRRRDNPHAALSSSDFFDAFGPTVNGSIVDFTLLDDLRKQFVPSSFC